VLDEGIAGVNASTISPGANNNIRGHFQLLKQLDKILQIH
jgi:hypothetical protein